MPYPTKYTRQYGFQAYQDATPNRPLPGDKVDYDLNAVATSSDEVVEFLKLHTRSDGLLKNGVVSMDSLGADVLSAIALGDANALASVVTVTPAGGISATNVQDALEELDAEKQPLDGDLTALAGASATGAMYTRSAADTWTAVTGADDDVLQKKAGQWTNRTIAQLLTDLAAAGTTFQPLDGDLTAIAALSTTSFGRSLLTQADASAARTTLGAAKVQTFDVTSYGAVGDDTTDDTAAINLAAAALLAYVQSIGSQSYFVPAKLYFPPGKYRITGSINLQFINGWGWSIEGHGAVIRAACAGKTALDLIGSRFGTINGLTIIGDSTNKPAIGIQLARGSTSTSGDCFTFNHVTLVGHFTRAAIYNMGSETNTHNALWIWNKDTAGGVGYIIDGLNHLGPITDFTNTTVPTDTLVSCTQHTFVGCSILVTLGSYGAPCVALYNNATQVRFVNSYLAGSGPGVKLIAVAGKGDVFLDQHYDFHYELGTANVEVERTSSGSVTVVGLHICDVSSQSSTALIKAGTNVSYLKIEDLDVESHGYTGALISGPIAYSGQVAGRDVGRLAIGDSDRTLVAITGDLGRQGSMSRVSPNATLTAARTWTLPAANTVPIGWVFNFSDETGGVSTTNRLTIQRASSDTINGGTKIVLTEPYSSLALVSDGASKWTVVSRSANRREVLLAARTYYVRSGGSGSNTGLSSTDAFATLQQAVDAVAALDRSTFNVTIDVGASTFTGGCDITGWGPGSGTVTFNGAGIASTTISTTSDDCFNVVNAKCTIQNMKLETTTSGCCIRTGLGADVTHGAIDFGVTPLAHIWAEFSGRVQGGGASYTISGGAIAHILCRYDAVVSSYSGTVTLSGTPAFSSGFIVAGPTGTVEYGGRTFSGSATGTRYVCTLNAVVSTSGGGATYLPGNANGTPSNGGVYV